MQGHEKSVEIITSIINRYNSMMPDIFKKLNTYEKELLQARPRHTFSKQDCLHIMRQSNITPVLAPRLDIISEVVLLLYNWYKSKQIYSISDELIYNEDVFIDREKIKLFPYSGIYIDLEFYSLDYEGCFITLTREPHGASLRRYMLIGFVNHNRQMNEYSVEPFMLELQDGIKVEDAFIRWYNDNPFPQKYVKRNVIASFIAVANLYSVIDTLNQKKEIAPTTRVKRDIVTKTLSMGEDNDNTSYRISNQSKYKYQSNSQGVGTGTQKAPHTRRTHNRHLPIKDDEGNIIGEKVITIKKMRIHAEQENKITVRKI